MGDQDFKFRKDKLEANSSNESKIKDLVLTDWFFTNRFTTNLKVIMVDEKVKNLVNPAPTPSVKAKTFTFDFEFKPTNDFGWTFDKKHKKQNQKV